MTMHKNLMIDWIKVAVIVKVIVNVDMIIRLSLVRKWYKNMVMGVLNKQFQLIVEM